MARIYDNLETRFTEGLQGIINNVGVKRVDFCVGYFNLRGWNLIVNEVDQLEGDYVYENNDRKFRTCRLLIGMHRPDEDLIRQLYSGKNFLPDAEYVTKCKQTIARDFKKQLLLGLPTKNDECTLRRLSAQMKDEKVCVKLYLREPLHAKLYLAHRPDDHFNPIQAIMGSSNLTYSGLTRQGELNAEFGDSDSAAKLSEWFEQRWNDKFCIDITRELIDAIDHSWAGEDDLSPYYIYLKTVYHLSQEARSGIKEFSLPPEFRNTLFDFQQNAVKIAAKHLNNDKRHGAMIGDVVGLGKTITACAIAKIYEMTYASSTLIICPANLQDMWAKYKQKYDLKADIVSMQKPIDVENTWNYRLVIVDESHNLRNNNGKRYHNIQDLIHKLDCATLLLTATPYNKDFSDLASQLKLFLSEDQDLGIRPEAYIQQLGGEREFQRKHSDVYIRSIKAFEQSDQTDDWSELMKLFLVRRTRTFIKNNFAREDATNGRKYLLFPDGSKSYFPDRIPKAIKFKTQEGDQYSRLYSEGMVKLMEELLLPRYGLIKYLSEEKASEASVAEKRLIENLSKAGQRMMGFCKSTFFKRMDSSGFAFLLTLKRHILRNAIFLYAIDQKINLPIGDENALPDDFMEDEDSNGMFGNEEDEQEDGKEMLSIPTDMKYYEERAKKHYELLLQKNNVRWLSSKYFKRTLKQNLKKDCENIIKMILLCGSWNAKEDQKLNELHKLVTETYPKDKVVIFTQYSDTAQYLTGQLRKRGITHIDIATGGSQNTTSIVEHFSPISNEKSYPEEEQSRILVATDVLSEGQNLQDAHIIINYDLPWAIIRLIQRAGRVDRIGQQCDHIDCYSFFPADGVEKVIQLRKRLNARINEAANVVGSDEVFFEGNEQNLRDMYNEKSGSLDDVDDNDVDLASQAYQIWKNATDANPDLKRIIPSLSNMINATKKTEDRLNDGAITYAQTRNGFDVLSWYNSKGEIVSQSQKRILQAMECSADEPRVEPSDNHYELVKKAIDHIGDETSHVGGILGSRFSTRYKTVQILERYYEKPVDIFFSAENKEELKYALNDIYNYPLQENAKFNLGRMMRQSNMSNADIVEYVIDLRKNNQLCIIDEDNSASKEPKIICSMGLRWSEE